MTSRRLLLVLASLALSALLLVLLIRIGKVDLHLTLHQLKSVHRIAFAKLILLNVLLIFLSTEKWRSVDAAVRRASDSVPSWTTAFAITSTGMALGLVLPVQFGMAAARTLGTYFHGRSFRRGMAGTLFEQSFDLLIVCFLSVASGVTWFYRGGAVMWTASAAAMAVLALLAVGLSMRLIRLFAAYAGGKLAPNNRIGMGLKNLSELENSGVLSSGLARKLLILSTVRFGIVVLMAEQTAEGIGAPIELWHLAAAIPFVVFATALAITPGGLGVNELTYATALSSFGTPFSVAARWALANRVLGLAACFIVATSAAALMGVKRLAAVRDETTFPQISDTASEGQTKELGRLR